MGHKNLKKSNNIYPRVGPGQTQRRLPGGNNKEPFHVKRDEYSLSGDRFQREQVGSSCWGLIHPHVGLGEFLAIFGSS